MPRREDELLRGAQRLGHPAMSDSVAGKFLEDRMDLDGFPAIPAVILTEPLHNYRPFGKALRPA